MGPCYYAVEILPASRLTVTVKAFGRRRGGEGEGGRVRNREIGDDLYTGTVSPVFEVTLRELFKRPRID